MISESLLRDTFSYFKTYKDLEEVVQPSLPILYFGNLSNYEKSELKIVTVGKNPSDNEFRLKKTDPFSFVRFDKWEASKQNLIETLNPYFDDGKPLKKWFSSYEPILNSFDSSYYSSMYKNIALHTDLCSPLATDPTWSKLSKESQQKLYHGGGLKLWISLIAELQPDIMLISIPKGLFQSVVKTAGKEVIVFNDKINGEKRKSPYKVSEHEYVLSSSKKVRVIFGQAANKPFDTISNKHKLEIGKRCLQ